MVDRYDAENIKKRIEALVVTASLNARNQGGDAATAAADLMCAFVLITMRSGGRPQNAIEAMAAHAIADCADFWGAEGRNLDA